MHDERMTDVVVVMKEALLVTLSRVASESLAAQHGHDIGKAVR